VQENRRGTERGTDPPSPKGEKKNFEKPGTAKGNRGETAGLTGPPDQRGRNPKKKQRMEKRIGRTITGQTARGRDEEHCPQMRKIKEPGIRGPKNFRSHSGRRAKSIGKKGEGGHQWLLLSNGQQLNGKPSGKETENRQPRREKLKKRTSFLNRPSALPMGGRRDGGAPLRITGGISWTQRKKKGIGGQVAPGGAGGGAVAVFVGSTKKEREGRGGGPRGEGGTWKAVGLAGAGLGRPRSSRGKG